MSVESLSLVLQHSRASGTEKVVLLGIANHDGDGGAWPSIATLAGYANVSERTVQRAIESLVHLGELAVDVNRGGSLDTRSDRRPNRYRILVSHGVTPVSPRIGDGVTSTTPRGDIPDAHGVTPVSPEPSLEPSMEPNGADAPRTAQTLIAEWIDHCTGGRPPSRVIGHVSREVGGMLTEGIPYEDVRRGLAMWHQRSLHPSVLASVVHECRQGPRSVRQSPTDAVRDVLRMGAEMQAELDRQQIGA